MPRRVVLSKVRFGNDLKAERFIEFDVFVGIRLEEYAIRTRLCGERRYISVLDARDDRDARRTCLSIWFRSAVP
jgi:hypothetical protein